MINIFEQHFRDQDKAFDSYLADIERKAAYEIRPATITEVKFLCKNRKLTKQQMYCAAFTFTLRLTGESRVILAIPGLNPKDVSADELDMLWSQLETRN